jgi:chromosome segregation protein
MFLKSIELHGFKSFASKTTVSFLEPRKDRHSITAIVGPNGSGKSNISDAIRWVLGEQSLKQLRGKKSADVIFSGSETKGQMSVASVSLIFDNTDKKVPIDYEELVITRKLYRSGESDYLVNGAKVRLIDLQILLAKAQFAHGSYSVIGQGTIDRMLLQTPQERKAFFDEAAGIKEFQIKRHQSFLKLNKSREHIAQAELLLGEITPRLKTLSRQVKKLEQRKEVETALLESQEQYYVTLGVHYNGSLEKERTELASVQSIYDELNEALTKIQTELASLAQGASREDVFSALQREYSDVQAKKNTLERERAILSGKMQTAYSQAGQQNVGWLESKRDEVGEKSSKLESDIQALSSEISLTRDKQTTTQKKIQEIRLEMQELHRKKQELERTLREAETQSSVFQYTGLRAVEAILSERRRFGGVLGAVAQLGRVAAEYQLALDVAAGGNLSSVVVEDERVAESCIRYLRESKLGYATFLPLTKIRGRHIPQDIEQYLGVDGVIGLAIDLIEYDEKFEDIFSYTLGNTVIVDTIETARRVGVGRVRMVTLDGDILEKSGSMKGGFRKKRTTGLSFSQESMYGSKHNEDDIKEELSKLEDAMALLEATHKETDESLRILDADAGKLVNKRELLEEQKHEIDREKAGFEQELSLSTMSESEYDSAMKDLHKERDEFDKGIASVEKDLEKVQKKIDAFNKEEEEKRQRVFSLQEKMQTVQAELNDVVDKKNALQVEIAKLETKVEDLEEEVYHELHTALAQIIERVDATLTIDKLEDVQGEIDKLKYKLSLIGGIDQEVVDEHAETKQRHDDLSVQLDDLTKTVKDLELLIAELDEVMRKKRKKAFKEIKNEFKRYFKILFEGGEADLVEMYGEEKDEDVLEDVEADDPSDEQSLVQSKKKRGKEILQGIDVKANPPGKKIKNVQSLSGGERTMVSIALVCAILRTNPSPFVFLDEVEAALDEANTLRFTNILQELAISSQFILITHNRVTMHAADALYGVTMGNDGMSKLLSVKLGEAEKVVE